MSNESSNSHNTSEANSANDPQVVNMNNIATVDVGHHEASDDDPTGAKAAGGLVNSEYSGPHSDAGDRPGSIGAFGAGGGGSNTGPAQPGVTPEPES